jgi:signal transduction histidine kinase
LLDAGLTTEPIVAALTPLPSSAMAAAVSWISASRSLAALLREVAVSAERISDIVGAVRSYVYLDQAPVQQIDLHRGLDDTLLLLKSKLEPGITVHREYSPDVPSIEAFGSELNQVWTNLIANAAEALGGQGEIWIRTGIEGERVRVEICDNGPGIPAEVSQRIFEPFFTTKPPGQGTGLGLHISYNIVALHHQGEITVVSRPGETCFRVLLPDQLERGPA